MSSRDLTTRSVTSVLVAPSILAADFSCLGEEITRAVNGGCDVIHVDVMDGHFVPNLSVGPPVVEKIRHCTSLPFDVHLMLEEPEKFVDSFADAGADNITVHTEVADKAHSAISQIRSRGCTAGVTVKPDTPAEAIEPFIDKINLVLVMTVEPGFGGQKFRGDILPKIRKVRELIQKSGRHVHVEVDGGIDRETAPLVLEAGANVLVAGTSVFKNPGSLKEPIDNLRNLAG